MWGFAHSSLVTVPVTETFFSASNTAEKEWCASTGATAANERIPISNAILVLIWLPLSVNFTPSCRGRHGSTPFDFAQGAPSTVEGRHTRAPSVRNGPSYTAPDD